MTAAMYVIGCVAGGLTSALALWVVSGLVAPLPPQARLVILVAGLSWSMMPDGKILGLQLPQWKRQIAQNVLMSGDYLGVAQFGFEIGTGMRTYLPTTAGHVLAVFLVFGAPTLLASAAAGLGFGLGRELQLVATAVVRDRSSFLEGWNRPVVRAAYLAPVLTVAVVLSLVFVS